MRKIERLILKTKISIHSLIKKINLPLTKTKLIDNKKVRHVYRINENDIKVFYCMINGKSYMIKYNEMLERWLKLSEIEIKKSEKINKRKEIIGISNLKEYKEVK